MKNEKTRASVNATAHPTPFDIARAERQAEFDGKPSNVVKLRPALPAPADRLPTDRKGKTPPLGSPYWTERAENARADMVARLGAARVQHTANLLFSDGEFYPSFRHGTYPGVFEHNCLTLATALACAEKGLRIVDLHGFETEGYATGMQENAKIPRGAGWSKRATAGAAQIEKFWQGKGRYPANDKGQRHLFAKLDQPRNLGIATGGDVFALDLDGPAGMAWLAEHEARLPASVSQTTGSGGRHFLFRLPEGVTINNTAAEIAPGVDIRGEGGQIVAAPSMHKCGTPYRWDEGCAPWERDIAEAPAGLIELAQAASKKGKKRDGAARRDRRRLDGDAEAIGFRGHLDNIGDGAGGFDKPIYQAACAWFAANGADTDETDMIEDLRTAILEAQCDDDRHESRYATDAYLEERVEQAREYIAKNGGEDCPEAVTEETASADGADNPFLMAGGQDAPVADKRESASAENSDVIEDDADSAYEDPKKWLPEWYKIAGGAIKVLGDKDDNGKRTETPICQAFDVLGRSSNEDGTAGAGRIIHFTNENGKSVELTISRADIAADGKAVLRDLADAGLLIYGRGGRATDRLLDLLNEITPQRQIPTVNAPGWVRNEHGDVLGFMAPTGVYDRVSDTGPIYRLLEGSRVETVKPRGTLDGWRGAAVEALKYADTNFYWPLGLIAGFAGPILGILDWQPIGFSLSGKTSKGKTLAQLMGSTVWSSPMPGKGVLFTANTTGNAMEDLSVRGTDSFLALDEVGALTDKRALSAILFALSTGRTKSRKSGRGRGLTQGDSFRPFTILSNEKGMRAEIQAAGDSYRGGLAVRFPDIDVSDGVTVESDALERLGAFNLHYGQAGPVFVRYLIAQGIALDAPKLEKEVLGIAAELATSDGGIDTPAMRRAARVFAVAQRAGEIAADAGLLGDVVKAKTAIKTAVCSAWGVYAGSDEAKAASSGDGLLDVIAAKLNGMWDRTIIEAGDIGKDGTAQGEAQGETARGTPLGWYDGTHVYLDWAQLKDPVKVLGVEVTRAELVKSLGDAVEWKSEREAPQSKLPAHVAKAASGDGRAVRNLKLDRAKIGL